MTSSLPGGVCALVLAGGGARRLGGGDKPLLALGGGTLLAHVLARLRAAGDLAIALSANGDPARFAGFGLPVLDDGAFAGQGPLAGVLAGLDWAASRGAGALLTVPGDTPFIPRDLAARLAPSPSCAASGGRVHHLVALWPVAARAALRSRLAADGPRNVAAFAVALGLRAVAFAVEDQPCDPFLNVNTPEDLARAQVMLDRVALDRATLDRTGENALA